MKGNLYLNARRNGYAPDQCGLTMTVGELIEFLEQFDYGTKIYLKHDGGYTYGNVLEYCFEGEEMEEDYYA